MSSLEYNWMMRAQTPFVVISHESMYFISVFASPSGIKRMPDEVELYYVNIYSTR